MMRVIVTFLLFLLYVMHNSFGHAQFSVMHYSVMHYSVMHYSVIHYSIMLKIKEQYRKNISSVPLSNRFLTCLTATMVCSNLATFDLALTSANFGWWKFVFLYFFGSWSWQQVKITPWPSSLSSFKTSSPLKWLSIAIHGSLSNICWQLSLHSFDAPFANGFMIATNHFTSTGPWAVKGFSHWKNLSQGMYA